MLMMTVDENDKAKSHRHAYHWHSLNEQHFKKLTSIKQQESCEKSNVIQ